MKAYLVKSGLDFKTKYFLKLEDAKQYLKEYMEDHHLKEKARMENFLFARTNNLCILRIFSADLNNYNRPIFDIAEIIIEE